MAAHVVAEEVVGNLLACDSLYADDQLRNAMHKAVDEHCEAVRTNTFPALLEHPVTKALLDDIANNRKAGEIRVGDTVRVKKSVRAPKYKWSDSVNHASIGTVKSIDV